MKFLTDECVSPLNVVFLRNLGFEVYDCRDFGMAGTSDKDIISLARKKGFILITFDTDFADIFRYPLGTHPGIVVVRAKFTNPDEINLIFKRWFTGGNMTHFSGALTILTRDKMRVRRI